MKHDRKGHIKLGLIILTTVFITAGIACFKQIPPEQLKASVELTDIETSWEKKFYQPWPPRLILVPAISFRIKNIGDIPLKFIYCNAIFKFKNEQDNLGDNFVAGIGKNPVLPGDTSEVIRMQSFYGAEGKNVAHFQTNPGWQTVEVKVFIKSKGSQYILVGEYDVSKKINFTEDESVGMDPDKKDPDKKRPLP